MKFGKYSSFSFVDVETTGTSAIADRVLEIGIIRVDNGVITGELNTLIDSDSYIPPEITTITGITSQDILSAPHFSDVSDRVQELLADSVFVAHNARFDHAFIKHEFRRMGQSFHMKTLDTVKLSRQLYPSLPRHNLDAIIAFLNIEIKNRHRAYDDAYVLYELLKRVHAEFPEEQTEQIFYQFLKSPSLPRFISKDDINRLPEGPGVYLMYGEDETLLYIGKSIDVRARVLSHFYNDFNSSTDIKLTQEVRRIDSIAKSGDMSASILESHLIKLHQPIHNRVLRRNSAMVALKQTEKDGYLGIEFVPAHMIKPDEHHDILGIMKGKRRATDLLREIGKEYKLCLKCLGVEKGTGRCFGSQIGHCNGACVQEEPAFKHNVRFVEAFTGMRVPQWPFEGPIGIKEQFDELEEVHIVDNWCYVGSITRQDDNVETFKSDDVKFDWDLYKILRRFIMNKRVRNIAPINLEEVFSSQMDSLE